MSVGRDALRTSVARGFTRAHRRSSLGPVLGSPLEEARRSIVADVTSGEWHFFGSDASGGRRVCAAGSHRQ